MRLFLMAECQWREMHIASSADLQTDEAQRVRIANRLSRLSHQALRRNSVSVEQIQDSLVVPTIIKKHHIMWSFLFHVLDDQRRKLHKANLCFRVRREQAEAGEFCVCVKTQTQNQELPLHASEQDKPCRSHHLQITLLNVFFISSINVFRCFAQV